MAIDIGGTKTLVASFTKAGEIIEQQRFLTPQNYREFIRELAKTVAKLSTKDFSYACVALPGKVDRTTGTGVACGNLPWRNVPIVGDIKRFANCGVVVENDANLAGLSEAIAVEDHYDRVLYVTISTGIGTGMIVNQKIDPDFQDSEGGHIILEHHGRRQMWERFASGSAIVRRFGKRAQNITDAKTWRIIAHDLSTGFIDLAAIMRPEVIICGGGVSTFYDRFDSYLKEELTHYSTPLTPTPPVRQAKRPNEAVVYGCYYLAKRSHEKARSTVAA
ncbi:MAG: ROK family protein [Candidatus Saccharibacteria bacterium]